MKQRRERAVFRCPNCGAGVKQAALACRECGSDADTGWRDQEEIDYAQVDLPDGYRTTGASDELPPSRTPVWVVVTALVVAALLVAGATGLFAFW